MCGPSAVPRSTRRLWRAMMHLPTWSVCPRELFLGVDEKSCVFSGFLLGGHAPARRRSRRASALHVCAFAYLPIVVLVRCLVEQESQPAGWVQSRKLAVFWAAGGSTRGSTLVRVRVRTYAARELRFSGLYPARVIRDACYGLCSFSFA